MPAAVNAVHVSEIPAAVDPEPGSYEWKPVRHHFGIESFGVNAFIAPNAGDWAIEEHTETEESGTRHEELYFVASGHARFSVDGTDVDAPTGTFVYVRDPAVSRGARGLEPGTTVLAMGAEPGAAFAVSPWERKYFE
jgi:mannose-6-phosphate isomerase-like protein (cupin superfamily)